MTCPPESEDPPAAELEDRHPLDFDPDDPYGARKPRKRRGPRKATKSHLENAALHYLGRFASSSENLRRMLMRRVDKSAAHHGTDAEEGAGFVDDIIQRYQRAGLLDDRAFAAAQAAALHRRGTPMKGIRYKLMQKGVAEAEIDHALQTLAEEVDQPELAAALALARRRRIGPYRDPGLREERREKDLAALARAGFDYETARRIIEAESVETLEEDLSG